MLIPSRRMRHACIALLASASIIPLCYKATASGDPVSTTSVLPVPVHEGWVNDTADILTAAEKQRLSDQLASYNRETHHQLALLTIPSLSGEAVEAYSLRVANGWGLGYRGIDNGMLVLVAVKEHAVRIELGKGMARYISNEEAKAIIDEVMVPEFRKGHYAAGLENGLQRLMKGGRRFVLRPSGLPASTDDL
jgi:uncharacterized membrane protein YgcG